MNYSNEFDPKAAAWLRELMADGLIPKGEVDERSITDVQPGDLAGFTQCHFFAGIGGWSLALRLAGWPEDRPIWTGSCPCQPFSCAGKGLREDDHRHLWPDFRNLIGQCRPPVVFGERVASKDGRGWLSGVRANLEKLAYAVGSSDLCAAGVSAPHIRQRLYWVAKSVSGGFDSGRASEPGQAGGAAQPEQRGGAIGMANTERDGGRPDEPGRGSDRRTADGRDCEAVRLADSPERGQRADGGAPGATGHAEQCEQGRGMVLANGPRPQQGGSSTTPTGHWHSAVSAGFWHDSVWHPCLDGKARRIPAESQPVFQRLVDGFSAGVDTVRIASLGFPLAPKIEGRAGILKGYGNAIVPELAAEFIRAYMQATDALAVPNSVSGVK